MNYVWAEKSQIINIMLRFRSKGIRDFLLACSIVLNVFLFIVHFCKSGSVQIPSGATGEISTDRYVCPVFDGGLGNQMFEYASSYGIAKSKGMKLALNKELELYTYFNLGVSPVDSEPEICSKAVSKGEYHPCGYDEDVTDIDVTRNTQLTGYLQSWKYFKNIAIELRDHFRFNDKVVAGASSMVDSVVSQWLEKGLNRANMTLIGVHIRRGDFLNPSKIDYGYVTASPDYLSNAMNYYRQKYPNTIFLCFTNPNENDTRWVREHVKGTDVIIMEPNNREIDMCIIANCNHTIMTVGSFGWWASWLNQGETIYSINFARNGSELEMDFGENVNDYFYPGWIGL